jgi:hypothetical protein
MPRDEIGAPCGEVDLRREKANAMTLKWVEGELRLNVVRRERLVEFHSLAWWSAFVLSTCGQ